MALKTKQKKAAIVFPIDGMKKSGSVRPSFPPLALFDVACCTPADWDIAILDEQMCDALEYLKTESVDVVALSVLTKNASRAQEIVDTLTADGIPVIVGGLHPTLFRGFKNATSVVLGSLTETLWLQVLEDLAQNSLQPVYESVDVTIPTRLNSRRFSTFEFVGTDGSWPYVIDYATEIGIGCNRRCTFCYRYSYRFSRKAKPVDVVVAELQDFLDTRGTNSANVAFYDDDFFTDRQYALELCNKLEPLGIKWSGFAGSSMGTDPELLDHAARSGCDWLYIGFESLSDESLSESKKRGNRPDEYAVAVDNLHSHGIKLNASFVLGLPGQDMSRDVKEIARFCISSGVELIDHYLLTPFPGTMYYVEENFTDGKLCTDWRQFDAHSIVENFKTFQDRQDLIDGFGDLTNALYGSDAVKQRMASLSKYYSPPEIMFLEKLNASKKRKYEDIATDLHSGVRCL